MAEEKSVPPTRIRRFLNGLDRATGGLTGKAAESFDEATKGKVTSFAHDSLYRLRQLGLRSRVAIVGRELSG